MSSAGNGRNDLPFSRIQQLGTVTIFLSRFMMPLLVLTSLWIALVLYQSDTQFTYWPLAHCYRSGPGSYVADRSLWRLDIVCWFWLSPFFSGISFNIRNTLGGREIGNILSSGRKIAHRLLRLNVIGWGETASRVKAADSRSTVCCI